MTKVNIEGIAIVEGISRNNIMYRGVELNKFAPTLIGRPILKDHANETDKTIGKVTYAESFMENGKTKVKYKGWVKEDGTGIIDKINDERIKEVSIGATVGKLVKESEDSPYNIAKDMTALELSTTPCPGVVGTSLGLNNSYNDDDIKQMITDFDLREMEYDELKCPECEKQMSNKVELKKHMVISHKKEMEEKSYSQLNVNNNEKEVKMGSEETKTENSSVSQDTVKLVESLALKEQELAIANKKINEMVEVQRQNAISNYNKVCESKKVKAVDVSNATMETIKALTEMVENIEVKVEAKETKKVETKTTEVKTANIDETMKGYVIEHSDLGGFAFYKSR